MEKQIENIEDRLDDHDNKFDKLFGIQDEQGKIQVKHEERMYNMKGEIKDVKNTSSQDMAETRASMKSIQDILTAMQIQFAVNDKSTKENEEHHKQIYDKSQSVAVGLMVGIPSLLVSITIIIVTILLRSK